MKLFYFYLVFILSNTLVNAQKQASNQNLNLQEQYRLQINKTKNSPKIDGVFDEECWQKAQITSKFWQVFPIDQVKSKNKTEVKMCFDDKFVYIAATCYDVSETYIIQTLSETPTLLTQTVLGLSLTP
jgi:hypothetical protein